MIQTNKIYHENCLEGMKQIEEGSIDAIICDLPYGTTACAWDSILPFEELWAQYKRVIKENGAIVLFGAEPFSTALRTSNLRDYKYDWYWYKNTATGFTFAKKQPMRSIETISIFCKGTPYYDPQGVFEVRQPKAKTRNGQLTDIYRSKSLSGKEYVQEYSGYPNNILKFDKEPKHCFHPTQKPVALLEYLVKTYTRKNELILDNCMGSGTTAIACLNTDRRYIGFETDPHYYEQSLKRIEENQTQMSLF